MPHDPDSGEQVTMRNPAPRPFRTVREHFDPRSTHLNLAGDLEATGWAAVMAAKEPAAAGQSGAESRRTEFWR